MMMNNDYIEPDETEEAEWMALWARADHGRKAILEDGPLDEANHRGYPAGAE